MSEQNPDCGDGFGLGVGDAEAEADGDTEAEAEAEAVTETEGDAGPGVGMHGAFIVQPFFAATFPTWLVGELLVDGVFDVCFVDWSPLDLVAIHVVTMIRTRSSGPASMSRRRQ